MNGRVHELIRKQRTLLGLILLMVVIFVWQLIVEMPGYRPFTLVPEEIAGAWEKLRNGGFDSGDLSIFGTMISSEFLHADASHIVNNMLFLWIFAALAVELLGSTWMLILFFATAFSASLGHTLIDPESTIPTLGASGVVSGFAGVYLGMSVRWKLPDPHIFPIARPIPPANLAILAVVFFAVDLGRAMNASQSGVAYGAHLGGFMLGLFLACFVVPKPRLAEPR